MGNWGNLNPADDKKFEEMTDKYMPGYGKADTLGGEIIRAINELVYSYYNNGDIVERYYSSTRNYAKAANDFLLRNVPTYISMRNIYDDIRYEKLLCVNLKSVHDYLVENEEHIFSIPNSVDYQDKAPIEEYDEWD